jgi:hypothetical protein
LHNGFAIVAVTNGIMGLSGFISLARYVSMYTLWKHLVAQNEGLHIAIRVPDNMDSCSMWVGGRLPSTLYHDRMSAMRIELLWAGGRLIPMFTKLKHAAPESEALIMDKHSAQHPLRSHIQHQYAWHGHDRCVADHDCMKCRVEAGCHIARALQRLKLDVRSPWSCGWL